MLTIIYLASSSYTKILQTFIMFMLEDEYASTVKTIPKR